MQIWYYSCFLSCYLMQQAYACAMETSQASCIFCETGIFCFYSKILKYTYITFWKSTEIKSSEYSHIRLHLYIFQERNFFLVIHVYRLIFSYYVFYLYSSLYSIFLYVISTREIDPLMMDFSNRYHHSIRLFGNLCSYPCQ